MAGRPTFIDLPLRQYETSPRIGMPSPRLQHFDGDIPPTLSPLDAFAAHSRALAKQLDDEQRQGRRLSRLPASVVKESQSLTRSDRPDFARSRSGGELSTGASSHYEDNLAQSPETEEPSFRPVSIHPRLSGASFEAGDDEDFMTPMERPPTTQEANQPTQASHYFEMPRTSSPEVTTPPNVSNEEPKIQQQNVTPTSGGAWPIKKTSVDSYPPRSTASPNLQPNVLSPRRPNAMRLQHESSDDDYTSSNAGSTFSETRKLSSSSGLSAPHSPMSPFIATHHRSPSNHSEISVGGTKLPKPAFNFSRPLSSASLQFQAESLSRPSQDTSRPSIQLSELEYPTTSYSMDDARSISSDGYLSGTGTYTHAKYSLPRGRMVSRNSLVVQGLSTPHFEWQEPLFQPDGSPVARSSPSSTSPQQPASTPVQPDFAFGFESGRPKTPPDSQPLVRPPVSPAPSSHSTASLTPSRPSEERSRPSVERGDLRAMRGRAPRISAEDDTSSRSDSTIRAQSFKTGTSTYTYMSAEDHLTKAIECHEKGSLKESTYHLRIAATQNNPTAMLLYALACRHGWGMRPNQREGVQWLRKAADCASLEIAEDEESSRGRGARDLMGVKARKAQFALSIYELGVSHLNGWGIEQDKGLALRCFEIAGNWGDADALAEAGYCYAQGVGCKKDLKKAAKFYRMAEAKGMNMVGNSW